jgi:hypothetical protein
MTMTAGSAVVSADSPPTFGNLHSFNDAIVPWIRELTDGISIYDALRLCKTSSQLPKMKVSEQIAATLRSPNCDEVQPASHFSPKPDHAHRPSSEVCPG